MFTTYRRKNVSFTLLLSAALLSGGRLAAANVYWDTSDLPSYQEGSGNWDGTSTNWTALNDGVNRSAWVDGDSAYFIPPQGGVNNTITIGSTVTVGSTVGIGTGSNNSATYTFSGAGALRLTGITAENPGGVTEFNVFGTGNQLTVNTVIAGSGTLRKTGNGLMTLTASNSFSGGAIIDAGRVEFGSTTSSGLGTGPITINGGWVQLKNGNSAGSSTFILNGGRLGLDTSTAYGNSINLVSAASEIYTSVEAWYWGVISGSGGFNKTGTGRLWLDANNTYTGTTTVSSGTLALKQANAAGTSTIVLNGGALMVERNIGFSNNINLVSTNSNIQVDGSEVWSGGVISGAGGLNKIGAGTLWLLGNNTYTGTTTVSSGTLGLKNGNAAGSSTIVLNGGTLMIERNIGFSNNINLVSTNSRIQVDGSESWSGGVISGAGGLNKIGAGTLWLQGNNTYTGTTTVSSGTLGLKNGNAAGSSTIVLNGGALMVERSIGFSNNINLVSTNSRIQVDGSEAWSGGVISGAGGLNKVGAGTLWLNGNNTYTGGTTITTGTLGLGADSAAGTGSIMLSGGFLQLNNNRVVNNSISLNAVQNNVVIGGTSDVATLGGVLAGTGTLVKAGAGTLILTNNNTYTGGTTISAGSLVVNGSVAGSVVVNSAGVLHGVGTLGNVTVNNGGTINAGSQVNNSVGLLSMSSLQLVGGSTVGWNVTRADLDVGIGYDGLKVSGQLDLSQASLTNKITLRLSGVPTVFNYDQLNRFKLFEYGSLNLGANTNITDLFTLGVSGLRNQYGMSVRPEDFSFENDSINKFVYLVTVPVVPEPSTYGLGLGILGLGVMAVRRRRSRDTAACC